MTRTEKAVIVFLAALKFVLPFLLQHPAWELHRDEYLYYEQGQHLDFGFLENPSLIGLLGRISSLAGGSFFSIRFWPSLFGCGTLLLGCGIARELGGRFYAQLIAAIGMLFTAYLRVHFLFQPNFLDIFCCTASLYFFLRYINSGHEKFIYLLLLALAAGWWSKYSVAFFGAALFLSILLTHHRTLFAKKHFWLAAALALILVLPNLIWQHLHHWPLFHHMEELQRTQLQYLSRMDFLKEQLLMLLPVAFVWIGGCIWLLQSRYYRVIALTYLLMVALLLLGSGKGYYALGAYPMLLGAGGAWLEQVTHRRIWLRYAAVVVILALSMPLVPLLVPMQSPQAMAAFNRKYSLEKIGLLKWEDQQQHPLQQDFADMLGWDELTQIAEGVFQQLPASEQKQTVVFCRNYGQAGALKYHAQTAAFRDKVISDNGTFLLWIPDSLDFRNLIFVGHDIPEKDDAVFQHFRQMQLIDSVRNPLSRQFGDKVLYYEQVDGEGLQLARNGLREMKTEFGH